MKANDLFLPEAPALLDALIEDACASIAPVWPLDDAIAVNPWWGWTGMPFEQAALRLSRLGQVRTTPDPVHYAAHAAAGPAVDAAPRNAVPLLSARTSQAGATPDAGSCLDAINRQISAFLVTWFDHDQADWQPQRSQGMYPCWLGRMREARTASCGIGREQLRQRAALLPDTAEASLAYCMETLAVGHAARRDWLRALLLQLPGWAGWCAGQRWQARQQGKEDTHLRELLAMRAAWECLVDDGDRGAGSHWRCWQAGLALSASTALTPEIEAGLQRLREQEHAYQSQLMRQLKRQPAMLQEAHRSSLQGVQAVFCIDVRSEPFRRALEQTAPGIVTRGFAGFFGLPLAWRELGTLQDRPQLPGLLAPTLLAQLSSDDARHDQIRYRQRRRRLAARAPWGAFSRLPASAFGMVEALGLAWLPRLLASSLALGLPGRKPAPGMKPRLVADARQKADIADKVLRAMGLTHPEGRIVLLAGHHAQSCNNPHLAGLQCGACGGHSGEVNARVLAALLNEADVRRALHARGLAIPESTAFLPGLHNTTTDEFELLDTEAFETSHAKELAALRQALQVAGEHTRQQRYAMERPAASLLPQRRREARDWSQTRPEWGLANNAAFIAAPRARTAHLDLEGRVFLHEHDCDADPEGKQLEMLMTGPMVVAHWINMQYYASTVEPLRYGSGNKLLHDVVGGRIGVFEGHGGDLRTGLPLQSVHDGERYRHAPLRLSVFIEAPCHVIDAVIDRQPTLRQLVDNGWLHLFCIHPAHCLIRQRKPTGWVAADGVQA